MLAHSVIRDDEDLAGLLAAGWGLRLASTTLLDAGTANCRVLVCDGERFFLKEHGPSTQPFQLERERYLLAHLARVRIPVSTVIPTCDGAAFVAHRERLFQLQSFVAGRMWPKHQAPPWLLEELAVTLGRIVRALEAVPRLPSGCGKWFAGRLPARAQRLRALATQIETAPWLKEAERSRLSRSARTKADIVERLVGCGLSSRDFTICNTHGDYSLLQVLCADKSIAAVVDFEKASQLPYVWEVVRSFTYAHPSCRHGGLDPAALEHYFRAFESVMPLRPGERRRSLLLYLLQLAPSTFGFAHLAASATSNQADLVEFACWRTAMCKTLQALPLAQAAQTS